MSAILFFLTSKFSLSSKICFSSNVKGEAIARALIVSPEIILADEPVSSLDPETAKEILKLLKDTAKKNKISILCSLHQVEFAKLFADRVVGMSNGKIIFDKSSKKLFKSDLNKIYK